MTIQFLTDEPALLIKDRTYGKILVIADIHLGIENELYNNGIVIAPQSKKLFDKIDDLIKLTKADKLVIIGDLKHKIPGITFRELKELPKFMEPLSEKVDVILVKGNHDTELHGLFSESVEILDASGLKLGPYGFFHGHAWPDEDLLECDYLFTAHIHPTVEFIDDFGFRIVEKVWMKGQLEEKVVKKKFGKSVKIGKAETIIFPSFNPVIGGVPLNRKKKKKSYIGPLLRNGALKVGKSEAYMLDGTTLGKISKIN